VGLFLNRLPQTNLRRHKKDIKIGGNLLEKKPLDYCQKESKIVIGDNIKVREKKR